MGGKNFPSHVKKNRVLGTRLVRIGHANIRINNGGEVVISAEVRDIDSISIPWDILKHDLNIELVPPSASTSPSTTPSTTGSDLHNGIYVCLCVFVCNYVHVLVFVHVYVCIYYNVPGVHL